MWLISAPYVEMQEKYVNMQLNHFDIQHEYVEMQFADSYVAGLT